MLSKAHKRVKTLFSCNKKGGVAVKEEQYKILKTMTEATSKIDVHILSEAAGLTPNETISHVQALADQGFLGKVGHGYGVTEKGKIALKAHVEIPTEMSFVFYNNLDQPTGFNAKSIAEFYNAIVQANVESLEFHLYRGDFGNWLREAIKDPELAEEFEKIRTSELKGEALRAELLKATDAKYHI
jgi:hypothetical protein